MARLYRTTRFLSRLTNFTPPHKIQWDITSAGGRRVRRGVRSFNPVAMSLSTVGSGFEDSTTKLLTVTRIFSDENGESRFGSFTITMTGSGDIGHLSERVKCEGSVIFRHTPSTYNYSWHNAPRRQFIVNLDGDVEVEVSRGEKRVISRGEVFFVEDLTGKGHYSRSVDGRPRHSIFIPVPDDFIAQDC